MELSSGSTTEVPQRIERQDTGSMNLSDKALGLETCPKPRRTEFSFGLGDTAVQFQAFQFLKLRGKDGDTDATPPDCEPLRNSQTSGQHSMRS